VRFDCHLRRADAFFDHLLGLFAGEVRRHDEQAGEDEQREARAGDSIILTREGPC
jgi:hypothetical protein